MIRPLVVLLLLLASPRSVPFDHAYTQYAAVLRDYTRPPRVDYAALVKGRGALDAAVDAFSRPDAADERAWTRDERLAFWINAYNAFTLRAIVDHYPIHAPWVTLQPRNSIRQIDGVWTKLTWRAAGRTLTLDDIEHRILRPEFKEPRVHFAINCASVGCPPLAAEPYRAETLDAQLDAAARRYLASAQGLRVQGDTLLVSKILEWYGEDFVAKYAPDAANAPNRIDRAVRGVIERFGPPAAAELARKPSPRVRFLVYDWSLNDIH